MKVGLYFVGSPTCLGRKIWRVSVCAMHRHPLLCCQQHTVLHLEIESSWLVGHVLGTVNVSSASTAHHLLFTFKKYLNTYVFRLSF